VPAGNGGFIGPKLTACLSTTDTSVSDPTQQQDITADRHQSLYTSHNDCNI